MIEKKLATRPANEEFSSQNHWTPAIAVSVLGCLLWSCGSTETQESCTAEAAKLAKSRDALQILIADCTRKFPAAQNEDGTFSIFVSELGYSVKVSGPKPSKEDIDNIKTLIVQRNKESEEIANKKKAFLQKASSLLDVNVARIQCTNEILDDYCASYSGVFTVKNNSDIKITKIFFGYAIGAGLDCRGYQNHGNTIDISIWPGQTVTHSFEIPFIRDKSGKGCASVSVSDIEVP